MAPKCIAALIERILAAFCRAQVTRIRLISSRRKIKTEQVINVVNTLQGIWIVATIISTVIFSLGLRGKPQVVKVKISKEIEDTLQKEGIEVMVEKSLINVFKESVVLGGAGGMAGSVIEAETIEKFVEAVKKNSIKIVYCAFKEGNSEMRDHSGAEFTKKYWGFTQQGAIVEFVQGYSIKNSSMYVMERNDKGKIDFDKNEVIYEKFSTTYIIYVAFVSAVVVAFVLLLYKIFSGN